ncbi:hypothetical protein E2C01_037270 [Portunus trituberculatus]|uniref:Uncharacterized protein n=1 Tax=Portunus trituberculatus TaxID=210409 RepID=A0A5B7FEI6_PORTR|nr:hypothetical protein [Portunus trituberculatus]
MLVNWKGWEGGRESFKVVVRCEKHVGLASHHTHRGHTPTRHHTPEITARSLITTSPRRAVPSPSSPLTIRATPCHATARHALHCMPRHTPPQEEMAHQSTCLTTNPFLLAVTLMF